MRGFLVLCLVAVATALPQGYNYNAPSYSGGGGGDYQHSASNVASASVPSYHGSNGGANNYQHGQQFGGGLAGAGAGAGAGGSVTKNIYTFAGAEDADDEGDDALTSASGRENYNILFVKAPAQSSASLAASLAKLQQKDKTVVYVLNKKTDASELQNALNQVKGETAKPEVFFIKYKTPQEAQHAQQEIKAQYDALGGTTNVSDEGVSPISSVIGSVGNSGGFSGLGSYGAESNIHATSNTYLPPSF